MWAHDGTPSESANLLKGIGVPDWYIRFLSEVGAKSGDLPHEVATDMIVGGIDRTVYDSTHRRLFRFHSARLRGIVVSALIAVMTLGLPIPLHNRRRPVVSRDYMKSTSDLQSAEQPPIERLQLANPARHRNVRVPLCGCQVPMPRESLNDSRWNTTLHQRRDERMPEIMEGGPPDEDDVLEGLGHYIRVYQTAA